MLTPSENQNETPETKVGVLFLYMLENDDCWDFDGFCIEIWHGFASNNGAPFKPLGIGFFGITHWGDPSKDPATLIQ